MKALDEYLLMVLFVLLLTGDFIFLQRKPNVVTTQMKALDEYFLIDPNGTVCVITEESSFSCKGNLQVLQLK